MPTKQEIREKNKLERARLDSADVAEKSKIIAEAFLSSEMYKKAETIMLYMPLGNEADIRKIAEDAWEKGKKTAFPVTDKVTGVITPYFADNWENFKKGAFSVDEPTDCERANIEEIDVFLVPGIGFDKSGARIGFGKGCYDKLLTSARGIKVGVCYEFQVCEKIKTEPHDVRMDFLVTENGLVSCMSF